MWGVFFVVVVVDKRGECFGVVLGRLFQHRSKSSVSKWVGENLLL